ncbi:MAG: Zn-dependent oxidoreductase [Anaerolineaceae bacterium]|nr:MAG: Zn-dependent oxidoreductase [Anaerolineaceae bacterium]
MRAVQLTGFGDVDRLELVEVPRPQPARGEVLIQVGACGLNNTDLNLRKGWYSPDGDGAESLTGWQHTPPQFPIIQGADIVGVIVGVGTGVPDSRLNQRVIVNPTIYKTHPENPMDIDYLGSERPGGFAQYVCVPAVNAHAITTDMSDAELATFPTSYLTAWHMLARADVQAGETVLVTGASGGVGSALLQLIKARDARAVAIVGRGKEDHAQALGAVRIIPRDVDDIKQHLGDITVDAVADVVGGAGIMDLMHVVRPGGRIVTAGAMAGPMVEIDLRTLYLRHLSLLGSTLGTAADFENLVNTIQAGQIKPLLAHTFPLAQLREAQQTFERKQFFGKIVIDSF